MLIAAFCMRCRNHGRLVLFDEFCDWALRQHLDLEDDDDPYNGDMGLEHSSLIQIPGGVPPANYHGVTCAHVPMHNATAAPPEHSPVAPAANAEPEGTAAAPAPETASRSGAADAPANGTLVQLAGGAAAVVVPRARSTAMITSSGGFAANLRGAKTVNWRALSAKLPADRDPTATRKRHALFTQANIACLSCIDDLLPRK